MKKKRGIAIERPQCEKVDHIPGSVQSMPFPDTHARFAYIEETSFGQATAADLFVPIPAVCHWLQGEWNEGKGELRSHLEENDINHNVSEYYLNLYQSGLNAWSEVIGNYDDLARNAVNTYLTCWKKEAYPAKEAEPNKWHPDVSRAIKKMMRIYALLMLGQSSMPEGSISPKPHKVYHTLADNGLQITFLCHIWP